MSDLQLVVTEARYGLLTARAGSTQSGAATFASGEGSPAAPLRPTTPSPTPASRSDA
jgi:hypothetical protein